jgi:uncharacterized membrane-anchored protein YitT (DUF2179 family)
MENFMYLLWNVLFFLNVAIWIVGWITTGKTDSVLMLWVVATGAMLRTYQVERSLRNK